MNTYTAPQDDFDAYDISCIAWVFAITETTLEQQHLETNQELPDYVIDELHGLRDRLTRLLRKRVSQ